MKDTLPTSVICLRPFHSLELNLKGDVSTCCPAWTKGMIGNVRNKNLQEIWNDKPLQHMRQMMLEGRWQKICRPNCPYIMSYRSSNRTTPLEAPTEHAITEEILQAVLSGQTVLKTGPTLLTLSNSNACNLNCIMCGRDHFKDDHALIESTMQQVLHMLPSLRELFLTGNGDPFARSDTRQLMASISPDQHPDLRIDLLTNGLLLPRYWDRVQHLNFGYLNISVDAADKETYETIRRGGKWEDLEKALELVSKSKSHFSFAMINMTVMAENYRQIPAFVKLAHRYRLNASISRIRGKWGNQNFFTSSDSGIVDELKALIAEARLLAQELDVSFDSSAFGDIMSGRVQSKRERYRQRTIDFLRHLYYKLK